MFLSRLKMVRNFNLQLRVKYALHFCADPQHVGLTKFQLEIVTRNFISGIAYFREVIHEIG